MLEGLKAIARLTQDDVARLKTRTISATVLFILAGVTFLVALGLGAAVLILLLVDRVGVIPGLAIAAGCFLGFAVIVLIINGILKWRYNRRLLYSNAAKTAMLTETISGGVSNTRAFGPLVLPLVSVAAFALTSLAVRTSKRPSAVKDDD